MWLHELDTELIESKALQSFSTIFVSLYLVEAIGNVVTSRT